MTGQDSFIFSKSGFSLSSSVTSRSMNLVPTRRFSMSARRWAITKCSSFFWFELRVGYEYCINGTSMKTVFYIMNYHFTSKLLCKNQKLLKYYDRVLSGWLVWIRRRYCICLYSSRVEVWRQKWRVALLGFVWWAEIPRYCWYYQVRSL